MTVRTWFAALAWTGIFVLAVFVTVRGIVYPDVHWALATPQVLEPVTSGSSEAIRPSRPAAAAGTNVTQRPKPAVTAPPRPKTVAARPAGAGHLTSKQPAAPLKLRWHSGPDSVKAFSPQTHYLSLPAYVRYVVHEQTGRWITYAEAAKMVKDRTIPVEAAAATP